MCCSGWPVADGGNDGEWISATLLFQPRQYFLLGALNIFREVNLYPGQPGHVFIAEAAGLPQQQIADGRFIGRIVRARGQIVIDTRDDPAACFPGKFEEAHRFALNGIIQAVRQLFAEFDDLAGGIDAEFYRLDAGDKILIQQEAVFGRAVEQARDQPPVMQHIGVHEQELRRVADEFAGSGQADAAALLKARIEDKVYPGRVALADAPVSVRPDSR